MREFSPERLNVVEAETFPFVEGTMCTVAMRDGDAPPGSRTASCTKGLSRNLGEPVGSVDEDVDGGTAQGVTVALRRAEAGSRTDSCTDETAEGNEARGGKGPARGESARERQGPDAEPGCFAVESRAGERGSEEGQEDAVHVVDAPRGCGGARSRISTIETESGARSRWGDGRELRGEVGGETCRPLHSRSHGTIPASPGSPREYPETRWWHEAARCAGA